MFKKYIQDIAKHEARKILLSNFTEKLSTEREWEHHYHNQVKYTETLVNKKDREILKLREKNKKLSVDKEFLKTSLMEASEYVKSLEQENEQLKEKIKWVKNDKDVLLKQISEQNKEIEKLKNENINDINIVQSEDANSKIETIGNMVEKIINENEKLKEKLKNVSSAINYYDRFDSNYYTLKNIVNIVNEIIKER